MLRASDAERTLKTLQKLLLHDISGWVLAGGLAVEIHCLLAGDPRSMRALNDIDFITAAFAGIPDTLSASFLVRHVHLLDPPGKTILQLVDAETALRVDVFRAETAILRRAAPFHLAFGPIQVIAPQDALARTARLLLALGQDIPVAAKHAADYLRLQKLTASTAVEHAWRDHRKADHPATFREADSLVRTLIETRRNLLVTPELSRDVKEMCPRCVAIDSFPLADPQHVLALLGYC